MHVSSWVHQSDVICSLQCFHLACYWWKGYKEGQWIRLQMLPNMQIELLWNEHRKQMVRAETRNRRPSTLTTLHCEYSPACIIPREFLLLERLGGDVATSIPGRIVLEKAGEEYFMLMVLWFEIYEERCLQCSLLRWMLTLRSCCHLVMTGINSKLAYEGALNCFCETTFGIATNHSYQCNSHAHERQY